MKDIFRFIARLQCRKRQCSKYWHCELIQTVFVTNVIRRKITTVFCVQCTSELYELYAVQMVLWTTQFPNANILPNIRHPHICNKNRILNISELTYWHRNNVTTCDILLTRRRLHYVNCFARAHINRTLNEIRYSFSAMSHRAMCFSAFPLCSRIRRDGAFMCRMRWRRITILMNTTVIMFCVYGYFRSDFDFKALVGHKIDDDGWDGKKASKKGRLMVGEAFVKLN